VAQILYLRGKEIALGGFDLEIGLAQLGKNCIQTAIFL
jgi:hypothetical protein